MASLTYSTYEQQLKDRYDAMNDQLAKQLETKKASYDLQKQQAIATQKETNRSNAASYQKAVDPFGSQNESLASAGIKKSGYADLQNAKVYGAYRNAIANSATTMQAAKANVDQNYLEDVTDVDTQKIENQLAMQQELLNFKLSYGDGTTTSSSGSGSGGSGGSIGSAPSNSGSSGVDYTAVAKKATDTLNWIQPYVKTMQDATANQFSSAATKAQTKIEKIQKQILLTKKQKQTAINTILTKGNLSAYEVSKIKSNLGL